MGRQAADGFCDGIPDGLGTMTGKGWSILHGFARPMPFHARQVQEHGEAGRALDQCADRRTAETENEVALPCVDTSVGASFLLNGSDM
ncbi:hypothetical protein GCM10017322_39650 [Paracoccus aerius]|nr:hypothetical protein GCM10017322_39650 [Paracoccus aerius]